MVLAVRDPGAEKVQSLMAKVGNRAAAKKPEDAVRGAEVVLFAIPARAMAETVARLGPDLNGKIVVDATNNVGQSPMHQLQLLRQVAPDSLLYRAFSNLGWENFADPVIGGVRVDLFYCGDAGDGQVAVDGLIADIGLRPVYIGDVEQAGIVDALTQLWFTLALKQGHGRHLALKLLTE